MNKLNKIPFTVINKSQLGTTKLFYSPEECAVYFHGRLVDSSNYLIIKNETKIIDIDLMIKKYKGVDTDRIVKYLETA